MIQLIQRSKYVAISMALVAMLVIAACGGDATVTPTPTDVPPPTQVPAAVPTGQVSQQPTLVDNVYQDPEGRFTMPVVGDWNEVETYGTYGHLALAEPPLEIYLVTVESDDLAAGVDAALRQVGIDPAALTEADTSKFGKWNISYNSLADDKGVTILAQVGDGSTYTLIVTGEYGLTRNPPDNIVRTVGGFDLGGEAILPATVEEFEAYVNDIVGDIPPGLSIAIALAEEVI